MSSNDIYDSIESLKVLVAVAQLPLPSEREEAMLKTLQDSSPILARLRETDLGETPPATAFDPRWV